MVTVSVIIPTHNRPALTRKAVESALDQRGVDVEAIVVDDGSTDNTPEALSNLGRGVTYIRQENAGACAARNRGLEAARGRFIKFLDSDDELEPNSLAPQIEALERAGADVCHGLWTEVGEGSDPAGLPPPRMPFDDAVDSLLADWWAAPFSYLVRAEAARSAKWDAALTSAQDFDYFVQIALGGARFVYSPAKVGNYLHHGGARVSRRSRGEWSDNREIALHKAERRLDEMGALSEMRRGLLALSYFRLAQAVGPGDRARFRRLIARARTVDPVFLPPGRLHPVLVRLLGFEFSERLLGIRRALRRAARGRQS